MRAFLILNEHDKFSRQSCFIFSLVLAVLHVLSWLLESNLSQYGFVLSTMKPSNYTTSSEGPLQKRGPYDPHLGARDANGMLYTVNPSPDRLLPPYNIHRENNKTACAVGIEGRGGRQVLNKVRQGVIAYQQSSRNKTEGESAATRPRVLCMVYTYERAHENVRAIARTWGRQCDGFFAASNLTDDSIGAIDLLHHGPEAYENMWQKIRSMWAYAYDYYRESYDYFYICGDDVYLAVDNLRIYLEGEQVQQLLNGHMDVFTKLNGNAKKWKTKRPRPLLLGMPMNLRNMTFPAGGCGYVLNRAALDWLGEVGLEEFLPDTTDSREDVFVGSALWGYGVTTSDSRDEKGAFRFGGTAEELFHFDGIRSPVGPRTFRRRYGVVMRKGMAGVSSETISFHLKGSDVPKMILRYHTLLQGYCDGQ